MSFGRSSKPFGKSAKSYGQIAKSYGWSAKSYRELVKSYGELAKSYGQPSIRLGLSFKAFVVKNFFLLRRFLFLRRYAVKRRLFKMMPFIILCSRSDAPARVRQMIAPLFKDVWRRRRVDDPLLEVYCLPISSNRRFQSDICANP